MPAKLCTYPGCHNIVVDGGCRCPQHPQITRQKRRYEHHYHQGKQIYNSSWWKRLRDAHLVKEPCCELCARFSIVTPATVVDHIIEIKDGGDPKDPNNLQSLCRSCHNRKTGEEVRKRNKSKGYKSISDF